MAGLASVPRGLLYRVCKAHGPSETPICASSDAMFGAEVSMRTTVVLDDDLVAQAQEFTGVTERSALLREALRALLQREAARRLAELGGSSPGLEGVGRRRARAE